MSNSSDPFLGKTSKLLSVAKTHIPTNKQKQGEATLGASVELMRLWKELDNAS